MRAMLIAIILAGGCVSPTDESTVATFTLEALGGSGRVEWPLGSGDSVMVYSGLDEEAGLASVEIEIAGAGPGSREYTATDFVLGRRGYEIPPFEVPESGWVDVTVRLAPRSRSGRTR